MEMQPQKALNQSDLTEELLRIENSLLYMQLKLWYFPCDYKQDPAALVQRRERIVAMIEKSLVE